jgi:hypothetical protein
MSDASTFGVIASILRRNSPSLLELQDRPEAYEHVAGLCTWDDTAPPARLGRSRYERVVMNAVAGQPLRMNGQRLRPVGMSGWSAIVFEREDSGREVIAIDELIPQLDAWERG